MNLEALVAHGAHERKYYVGKNVLFVLGKEVVEFTFTHCNLQRLKDLHDQLAAKLVLIKHALAFGCRKTKQ